VTGLDDEIIPGWAKAAHCGGHYMLDGAVAYLRRWQAAHAAPTHELVDTR
jgi:hypothetical protein